VHTIPREEWDSMVEFLWPHEPGCRVSHPKGIPPVEGDPSRPANEEHIIEQYHARDRSDSLSIITTAIILGDDGLSANQRGRKSISKTRKER